MVDSLLLVHSPLLGPSSMSGLAAAAIGRGVASVVPDLRGFATAAPPHWQAFVDLALRGAFRLAGQVGVVGHSGAGAMLPSIGAALGDRCGALIFVDAVVPPTAGHHRSPARLLELLDAQTTGALLANWFDWWPPEAIAEILPDAELRALLRSDAPRVPRALYDEPVSVPADWTAGPVGYLQLSEAYDDECARAAELGWPTRRLDGSTHLSPASDPETVLAATRELIDRLQRPRQDSNLRPTD